MAPGNLRKSKANAVPRPKAASTKDFPNRNPHTAFRTPARPCEARCNLRLSEKNGRLPRNAKKGPTVSSQAFDVISGDELVEPMRIELTTYALRTRRSPI